MNHAIAVDIGGTNTRVAIIDENYQIIKREQFPTDANSPANTIDKIKVIIDGFDTKALGIGLSCPGPLDLIGGRILVTTNLNEPWYNFEITKALKKACGLEVYLENDANLATLAESYIGQGKDYRYVQFLTVSTGLGSGLVIDKSIYIGAHGFAHEIAHLPLWRNGPRHGQIKAGGVEAISSGTAIVERARKAGLDVKHAGEVNELALKGDEKASEIMDDAKEYLANTIAIIYSFIDPEIVILGGSVALKIPGFVEDVEKRVKTKVFDPVVPYVKVVKSDLNEDSGLLGGACLVFSKKAQ